MNIKNILDEAQKINKAHKIKIRKLKIENTESHNLISNSILNKTEKFNKEKKDMESLFNLIRRK